MINMPYVLGINGSPRKTWNTAQMLDKALEGAKSAGAEVERVDLIDLKYTGCNSCFACKVKDGPDFAHCILKDDITPVVEKIWKADAVIFATPIYHWDVPGMVRNLYERTWFPPFMYQKDKMITAYKGKGRIGLIYTCNIPDPTKVKYVEDTNKDYFRRFFPGEPEVVWCCNTTQFEDYSIMVGNQFNQEDKDRQRREQFPKDLQAAFEMGKELLNPPKVMNW